MIFEGTSHKGECKKHRKTLVELVGRLSQKPHDIIFTNLSYHVDGMDEEADVLMERRGIWHFYEVKSRHSNGFYRKATEQYKRFKKAHPDMDIKGVYVTPQLVRRLD